MAKTVEDELRGLLIQKDKLVQSSRAPVIHKKLDRQLRASVKEAEKALKHAPGAALAKMRSDLKKQLGLLRTETERIAEERAELAKTLARIQTAGDTLARFKVLERESADITRRLDSRLREAEGLAEKVREDLVKAVSPQLDEIFGELSAVKAPLEQISQRRSELEGLEEKYSALTKSLDEQFKERSALLENVATLRTGLENAKHAYQRVAETSKDELEKAKQGYAQAVSDQKKELEAVKKDYLRAIKDSKAELGAAKRGYAGAAADAQDALGKLKRQKDAASERYALQMAGTLDTVNETVMELQLSQEKKYKQLLERLEKRYAGRLSDIGDELRRYKKMSEKAETALDLAVDGLEADAQKRLAATEKQLEAALKTHAGNVEALTAEFEKEFQRAGELHKESARQAEAGLSEKIKRLEADVHDAQAAQSESRLRSEQTISDSIRSLRQSTAREQGETTAAMALLKAEVESLKQAIKSAPESAESNEQKDDFREVIAHFDSALAKANQASAEAAESYFRKWDAAERTAEKNYREALKKLEDVSGQLEERRASDEGRLRRLEACVGSLEKDVQREEANQKAIENLNAETERLRDRLDAMEAAAAVERAAGDEKISRPGGSPDGLEAELGAVRMALEQEQREIENIKRAPDVKNELLALRREIGLLKAAHKEARLAAMEEKLQKLNDALLRVVKELKETKGPDYEKLESKIDQLNAHLSARG